MCPPKFRGEVPSNLFGISALELEMESALELEMKSALELVGEKGPKT